MENHIQVEEMPLYRDPRFLIVESSQHHESSIRA